MSTRRSRHALLASTAGRAALSSSSSSTTAAAVKVSPQDALAYCRDLVRKHDYDHYLCGLLYPRNVRDGYWALRSLFIELSLIRDVVSESHIGQMRLQFWRDAIEQLFSGGPPRQHPVLVAIAHTLTASMAHGGKPAVSASWIKRIISEREKDLVQPFYRTVADLENYAEATHASAIYLQLELLGIRSVAADHTASHIGKSYGIVTLLRATPYHASKRVSYLPSELFAKHGASEEDMFRQGPSAKGINDVVYDLASTAHGHLEIANKHIEEDKLPSPSITAMLAAVPARAYLKQLQKEHFNAFSGSLATRPWQLPWWLYKAHWQHRF
ncbi:isoprenoid synthase domain-containing protein [Syncephalis pseudoplumigaleata]|uniref:15-cis-phytoene synthase n=1 Tax=Syncephalis pseudoplumigaleata TaxID=1712513 RepID=A0A4P9Z524_9FUNG|nr:isoprenoid synthase domain-containing protein [Syncephalis pseudoplumigaleata]|eukprot:RKP26961.1 isoprenoid synthase domain-containing protein [Syncephalis pseudoplumigaleata]